LDIGDLYIHLFGESEPLTRERPATRRGSSLGPVADTDARSEFVSGNTHHDIPDSFADGRSTYSISLAPGDGSFHPPTSGFSRPGTRSRNSDPKAIQSNMPWIPSPHQDGVIRRAAIPSS
jgi:hypothetical protein